MSFVTTTTRCAVEVITINRQETLNSINADVLMGLKGAFEKVNLDSVHCVILSGAGYKSFVWGSEISYMRDFNKADVTVYPGLGMMCYK